MARKKGSQTDKTSTAGSARKTAHVYTITVSLLGDSGTDAVARTLELRGDQTLAVLHEAICDAFGYEKGPIYQFQRGAGPADLDGPRYVTPDAYDIGADAGQPAAGRADQTTLDALNLETGRRFSYWIDCGDDWWHEVAVDQIADKAPRGKYPKVIRRVGPNPSRQPDAAANDEANGTREVADAACLVGELHLTKREYRKAIEAFTRAIEENPTPDAFEGRAKAYRALAAADERASRRAKV